MKEFWPYRKLSLFWLAAGVLLALSLFSLNRALALTLFFVCLATFFFLNYAAYRVGEDYFLDPRTLAASFLGSLGIAASLLTLLIGLWSLVVVFGPLGLLAFLGYRLEKRDQRG